MIFSIRNYFYLIGGFSLAFMPNIMAWPWSKSPDSQDVYKIHQELHDQEKKLVGGINKWKKGEVDEGKAEAASSMNEINRILARAKQQGIAGVPTLNSFYVRLTQDAVSSGHVVLLDYLRERGNVPLSRVCTFDNPTLFHAIGPKSGLYLKSPATMAEVLLGRGVKIDSIVVADKHGNNALHKIAQNIYNAGRATLFTQQDFTRIQQNHGVKYDSSEEAQREFEKFMLVQKKQGADWVACMKKLVDAYKGDKQALFALKNAQGKTISEIVAECKCKEPFCKEFAEYLAEISNKSK